MAFRILTQVNYSAGENAEGDSGVSFTSGLLLSLVELDSTFHFYVLVPSRSECVWASALSHPRITPIPMPIERRLHGGDFQFCPSKLYENFDMRRYDVDLLFLNQPETVPAFFNFFNRQTFHNVPVVSYVHWFDRRRPSTPKETLHLPALLGALAGMFSSASVGCNSMSARDQILSEASRWFHDDAINDLTERIQVLPPGVNSEEIEEARCNKRRRGIPQILVNHRVLKYTGVRSLLTERFPKLWEQRRDFSVFFTNPTRVRLPATMTEASWLKMQTLPRAKYLNEIWKSDIVVAPHRACHWSISTVEAICAECIPLMNRESFFPELIEPLLDGLTETDIIHVRKHWFYYRSSFGARLGELIKNLPNEKRLVKKIADRARLIYGWSSLAPLYRKMFIDAEKLIPLMSETNPSMRRILAFIRQKKRASKQEILKHLKWAPKQRAVSWTAFRKCLKLFAHEDASTPEAVFDLIDPRGKGSVPGNSN